MIKIRAIMNDKDSRLLDIFADDILIATVLKFFFRKSLSFPSRLDNLAEAKKWFNEMEKKRAKSYLLYLLSRRSYHSSELMKKLKKKLISDKTINEVMKEVGIYLDDKSWIKQKIEKEFARGCGPKTMQAKFFTKGVLIDHEEMDNILTFDRQKEMVVSLLKRKFLKRAFDPRQALSYLSRRGFSYKLIKEGLSIFHSEENLPENEP
jgi:SOS response regulatory protein OraA/RecX